MQVGASPSQIGGEGLTCEALGFKLRPAGMIGRTSYAALARRCS
jgi:hypothetical protein